MNGNFFDPLGEWEDRNTVYTLVVHIPSRPPRRYVPQVHATPAPQDKSKYDCLKHSDLKDMKKETIKIKSHDFPWQLRCQHVRWKTECKEGCYVREKGGDIARSTCKRADCEGHVYMGSVKGKVSDDGEACSEKVSDDRVACFGKKGERLVCLG
ncbi:hypothetical protein BU26DRAFT_339515 [Trematosphaeria pertusa]|uniref:Uncharacterized protein n=1 Tax=Trematosphaeria pertusa TaxID=390896 RepID=A0A6A6I9T6_9PLEO|nr:uncharacterized protein BU26DRAFT_339515 [Trematosphaeria pertusa]KAF2247017.1 hypothetical protein BU26DRAFT_339515 [Trematosphaeria pertusa]